MYLNQIFFLSRQLSLCSNNNVHQCLNRWWLYMVKKLDIGTINSYSIKRILDFPNYTVIYSVLIISYTAPKTGTFCSIYFSSGKVLYSFTLNAACLSLPNSITLPGCILTGNLGGTRYLLPSSSVIQVPC